MTRQNKIIITKRINKSINQNVLYNNNQIFKCTENHSYLLERS